MTAILAIQRAADLLGVKRPTSIGDNDDTARKMLAFANEAGEDISRRGDWSRMVQTANVTSGALPADFMRLAPGGALTISAPTPAPVRGPLSTDQLDAIGRMGATTDLYFAMEGGTILYSRALAVGEVVQASYISANWLVAATFQRKSEITQDSDIPLFPRRLLVKGIVMLWRRDTGRAFEVHRDELYAAIDMELRQDRGVTT